MTPFGNLSYLLALGAALASLLIGLGGLIRRDRSLATWCFVAGMLGICLESLITARGLASTNLQESASWLRLTLAWKPFVAGFWLTFSLCYSRGNYREFLQRWRLVLAGMIIVPCGLALFSFPTLLSAVADPQTSGHGRMGFSSPAKFLNILLLISILLTLMNFERTLQAAVGTMRWRMKFLLLGLALIFGARVYTRTQSLLFSSLDVGLIDVETAAVLIGCVLIGFAHLRRGLSEADVYPSHAALQSSLTFLLVGCYLFLVGVLAQLAKWLGGSSTFQLQALIILLGCATLGMLLLSERLRQRIKYFVSRNFHRPHHDFRKVWRNLTERLVRSPDAQSSCQATARLVSETFNALSVSIWTLDEQQNWVLNTSTAEKAAPSNLALPVLERSDSEALLQLTEPFDLEDVGRPWAEAIRQATSQQFEERRRLAVVVRARDHLLGLIILGDRVYKMPFTTEEFELLRCLSDQLAAALLNFRLGEGLATAREMETFQIMSAFFVHDLKNSASSLNLMLQNLPLHFDNPEFRADALRGLGKTTGRINDLISRLSSFRDQPPLDLRPQDLNELVGEVLQQMGPRSITVGSSLRLARPVRVDGEQMKSVITNLLANAHEATPAEGEVSVETEERDSQALLTVRDSGSGMSADFVRHSLFRPFQTTKNKGIGIGMFQSRQLVESHGGRIEVHSVPGEGTTFRVLLPLSPP